MIESQSSAISTSSSSYESTVDDFDGDYNEAEETSCSDVTPGTSGSPSSVDVDSSSTNVSH